MSEQQNQRFQRASKAHVFGALVVISLAGVGAAQQAPVPMEEEPHHHVLLKNDFVEVVRAKLAPGESTLFHTHFHASAGFCFTKCTSTEQMLGKPEEPPTTSQAGEVWAEAAPVGPFAHRVRNAGDTPSDLFNVEFLQRFDQPSVAPGTPAAAVAAENASAWVYKWVLAPGATAAMHTHEHPYLIVAATAAHLKMTAPDGKSFTEELKAGDFHWVNSKVTHALTNQGAAAGRIVEFELK